jgi:hypothetical protein
VWSVRAVDRGLSGLHRSRRRQADLHPFRLQGVRLGDDLFGVIVIVIARGAFCARLRCSFSR